MADAAEVIFFRRFTQYVKFRLEEKGTPSDTLPPHLQKLVEHFEDFLKVHGGNPDSDAYKGLVARMTDMKDVRGGVGVPPKPSV